MVKVKGTALAIVSVLVFALLAGCPGQASLSVSAKPIAGGIELSWSPVSGIAGYNVFRSADQAQEGDKINSGLVVGQTSYVDNGVSNGVTYYYTLKAVDAGGSAVASAKASATARTSAPLLAIRINSGAEYTSQAGVSLSLSASGAKECRLSNDGISWGAWEAFAAQKSWTLSSGDGIKNVFFQCRDDIGNTALPVSASIYLDTTPPSISISSPSQGGQYSTSFELVFTVSDPAASHVVCSATLDGNPIEVGAVDVGKEHKLTVQASAGARSLSMECAANGLKADKSVSFTIVDKPSVSIHLADGSGYTDRASVSVSVTASLASECRFSNDGVTWGSWMPYSSSMQWQLTSGDGLKSVYAQCRGAGGSVSDTAHDTIILDSSPPPYISLSINNDARRTNSRDVILGVYAYAGAQCRFANDNANAWGAWEPYAMRKSWTLSIPEGSKTVYVNCKKTNGDDLGIASASIEYYYVPPEPPTGMRIRINNGASYTNSRNVVLDLYANGANDCRLRENNYDWGSWESYTSSRTFTVTSGQGQKTIYYQCQNDYGSRTVYDTIYLRTEPPPRVTDLQATAGTDRISLYWSNPGGRTIGFAIYRSPKGGSFNQIDTTTSVSYTDTRVTSGSTYSYLVRAVDDLRQESSDSNVVTATVSPQPPGQVTDLMAQPGTDVISLSWSAPSSGGPVSEYAVYRSARSFGLFTLITAVSGTSYIDHNVMQGEAYAYYVRARNSIGQEGPNSNVATADMGPPPNA